MASRPQWHQADTGGLLVGADDGSAREGSGIVADSRSTAPHVVLVSIGAFALASGFLAFGLTEVIGALVVQRSVRGSLQLATIPAVAIVAGLACGSTLTRVLSAIGDRHR